MRFVYVFAYVRTPMCLYTVHVHAHACVCIAYVYVYAYASAFGYVFVYTYADEHVQCAPTRLGGVHNMSGVMYADMHVSFGQSAQARFHSKVMLDKQKTRRTEQNYVWSFCGLSLYFLHLICMLYSLLFFLCAFSSHFRTAWGLALSSPSERARGGASVARGRPAALLL